MTRRLDVAAFATVLALLCVPLWTDAYRHALAWYPARDPYERLLFWMTGAEGPIEAPFAFRALSVLPALPLFLVAPELTFSNVDVTWEGAQGPFLRASFALATQHVAAVVGTALLVARLAARDHGATGGGALGAGAVALLLAGFAAPNGVDALGLALVAGALVAGTGPAGLAVALVGGAANDKVAIALAGVGLAGLLVDRGPDGRARALAGALALVGQGLAMVLLPHEGWHAALDGRDAVARVVATVRATLGLKGLLLNAVPVAAVVATGAWGAAALDPAARRAWLPRLGAVAALLAAGLWAGVERNLGRVVLYAMPAVAPVLGVALDRLLGAAGRRPRADGA